MQKRLSATTTSILLYSVYLCILLVVAMQNRQAECYHIYRNMQNILGENSFRMDRLGMRFYNVSRTDYFDTILSYEDSML